MESVTTSKWSGYIAKYWMVDQPDQETSAVLSNSEIKNFIFEYVLAIKSIINYTLGYSIYDHVDVGLLCNRESCM